MITPGSPTPSLPSPGAFVCIPFTISGPGSPRVTVIHANGAQLTPTASQPPHPAGSWVVCFTWPGGNTVSDVNISVGSDTTSFSVVGTGGP